MQWVFYQMEVKHELIKYDLYKKHDIYKKKLKILVFKINCFHQNILFFSETVFAASRNKSLNELIKKSNYIEKVKTVSFKINFFVKINFFSKIKSYLIQIQIYFVANKYKH